MGLFDHLFKTKQAEREEIDGKIRKAGEKSPGELPEDAVTQPQAAPLTAEGVAHPRPSHVPSPKAFSPRSLGAVVTPGRSHPAAASRPGGTERRNSAALPIEPGEVVVSVDDVLPRIPAGLLSEAAGRDGHRPLRFRLDELDVDFSRGRASVALSQIAGRIPEFFRHPVTGDEDVPIRLPMQKVVEQMAPRPAPPGRMPGPGPALPGLPLADAGPDAPPAPTPEAHIALSVAAILRTCPPEILKAEMPAVSDTDKVTFPFAPIERQLPHGKVDVSSARFIAALPPALAPYFHPRDDIRVPLPLDEIFQNLPDRTPTSSAGPMPSASPVATAKPAESPPERIEAENERERFVSPPKDSLPADVDVFNHSPAGEKAPEPSSPVEAAKAEAPPSPPPPPADAFEMPPAAEPAPDPQDSRDSHESRESRESHDFHPAAGPMVNEAPSHRSRESHDSHPKDLPDPETHPPEAESAISESAPAEDESPPEFDAPPPPAAAGLPLPRPSPWMFIPAPPISSSAAIMPETAPVEPPAPPTFPVRVLAPPIVRPCVAPPPLFGSPEAAALAARERQPEIPAYRPSAAPEPPAVPSPPPPPPDPLKLDRVCAVLELAGEVSLAGVGAGVAALPGLQACVLSARRESATAGAWPAAFDGDAADALFSALPDVFKNHGARVGAGAVQHVTIFGDEGCVSLFSDGEARLAVFHRARVFMPGVREKLSAVAAALAGA